jgi:hypothetical protein
MDLRVRMVWEIRKWTGVRTISLATKIAHLLLGADDHDPSFFVVYIVSAAISAPHSLRPENSLFHKKSDNSGNGGLSENKKDWQRMHTGIIFYGRIEEQIYHESNVEACLDRVRLLLHNLLWSNIARKCGSGFPEWVAGSAEKLRKLAIKTSEYFPILLGIVRVSSKSAGFHILRPLPWV